MKQPRADLSEWYHAVLEEAEVIDARYNIKGCYVWRPFGFKLRQLVFDRLRQLMESSGHEETLFPMLIPQDQLMKEAAHVKGFEDSVYWVTKGGLGDLDVPLALRPTSETIIYPMFALWIRSHSDLPLKVYQVVNTFRYETKHTRPLIRDREVSTFKEAHCAHADQAGVDEEMATIRGAYNEFFDDLCMPSFVVERPAWDRFPGAVKTVAWDTVMPDRKTLQNATSHDLGTSFAKMFNVLYEDANGKQQLCHLNSHGVASRVIGGMIMLHGDERGLVLPPAFAPIQAVVVPIVFKEKSEAVEKAAKKAFDHLSCRKQLDDSAKTPGEKYYYWELRGVPIRVEIGPRDVEKSQAVLVRRDTGEKKFVPLASLDSEVAKLLAAITKSMHAKALAFHEKAVVRAKTMDALKSADATSTPALVSVCGDEKCWKSLEETLTNMEFRGTLVDAKGEGKCIGCGKKAEKTALLSAAY